MASAAAPRPGPASAQGAGKQQQRGKGVGGAIAAGEAQAVPLARATLIERHAELFRELLAAEGRTPRHPTRAWARVLDRALARLDRYADFGAGRAEAGLEFALALLEADTEEVRWNRRREAPASVAYYAPLLDEVSKDWRRKSAPRTTSPPRGWRGSWAYPKQKRRRAEATRAPASHESGGNDRMEGRTIPLHGGGELTIGGAPLIGGLIHCWVRKPAPARGGNFMIGEGEAAELEQLLRARRKGRISTFAGELRICEGGDLLILWVYSWGKRAPDYAIRLYDGSIDTTANALEEVCRGWSVA